MTPLLIIALVSSITITNGQVYLAPPSDYQPYQQEPHTNQNTPSLPVTNQKQVSDDPYATMEIFKQLKKVPANHKPVHVPVEVKTKPEVQVQSSESNIQVQGSPTQNLRNLDYFSRLGGPPPEASEQSEDYSTIFPLRSLPVKKINYAPALKTASSDQEDVFPSSSPLHSFSADDDYSSGFSEPLSEGEIQVRPTRFYPLQENNFSPIQPFRNSGFEQNANVQKLEEIVDDAVLPKALKPKKKPSSKLKKFPKKYRSSYKKQKKVRVNPNSELLDDFSESGLKLSPTSEFGDDFSMDSLKDKRRIPNHYTGSSAQLSSPFSAKSNTYKGGKGSHGDYTAGRSGSRGFTGGSSSPAGYTEGSSDSGSFTGGSGGSEGFTGSSGTSAGYTGSIGSGGFAGGSNAFSSPPGGANGERMQFQLFGMDGPHSYKFGYDTGKGHNRHFRYEERDNHGKIKGHYGFYDQEGKMSMIHYEADPHTGYKAGPYHHPENHHDYDYNHQNSNDF